jgi:mono/diheme cytochrome c family protein
MDKSFCRSLRRIISISIFTVLFLSISPLANAQDGAALFKANCATCHTTTTQKLTGPGLEGVTKRVPSVEWMHKWIKNNEALIKGGDKYANKIFEENNRAQMTVFTNLSDAEIDAIIKYIQNPPVKEEKKGTPGTETAAGKEKGSDNNTIMIVLAAVLALLYFILKGIKKSLQASVDEKYNHPARPDYSGYEGAKRWAFSHKKHVAVILLILAAFGSKAGWDALAGIGVYQGYEPPQPIKFSHKIHAGENQISCVYCHSSAEKGKSAGVPSANVCMNCHKGIQSGTNTGTEEIAKIYKALDYDPNTQKYGPNQKPIKWVRIHNLPDLAYFNHSQHVVVGEIECQKCHGPVQEMDVVKQNEQLTMGWCVNCHRETEVTQFKTNPYYADLHKKFAEKYKGQKITVDKIGGIECARCHY